MKKRSRQKLPPKKSNRTSGTRAELLARANLLGIRGRHRMTKSQLIRALQSYLRRKSKTPSQPKASQSAAATPGGYKRSRYEDLPWSYGKTELVLMPVDPFLLHVYWDFSLKDWNAVRTRRRPVVLRIYDVTMIEFDGTNAHHFSDVPVFLKAQNWYVPIWSASKSLCADLGWLLSDGSFQPIIRSNTVSTPPAGPSISEETRWVEIRSGQRRVIKESTGMYSSKTPFRQTLSFWNKLEQQAAGLTAGKITGLSSGIIPPRTKAKLPG